MKKKRLIEKNKEELFEVLEEKAKDYSEQYGCDYSETLEVILGCLTDIAISDFDNFYNLDSFIREHIEDHLVIEK